MSNIEGKKKFSQFKLFPRKMHILPNLLNLILFWVLIIFFSEAKLLRKFSEYVCSKYAILSFICSPKICFMIALKLGQFYLFIYSYTAQQKRNNRNCWFYIYFFLGIQRFYALTKMPEFKHRRYDVVLKRVSTSEEILETMSELRKTSTTRMIIDVDIEGINSILEQVKLGTRKSLGLGWGGGGGTGVGMKHPRLSPRRPAYMRKKFRNMYLVPSVKIRRHSVIMGGGWVMEQEFSHGMLHPHSSTYTLHT